LQITDQAISSTGLKPAVVRSAFDLECPDRHCSWHFTGTVQNPYVNMRLWALQCTCQGSYKCRTFRAQWQILRKFATRTSKAVYV